MLGQGEFIGPIKPTIMEQTTQMVEDISKSVEKTTGLRNFAYYIGIGLIGYVVYSYMYETK